MDWKKFPLICAIVSTATGIRVLAEKQMEAVAKMRGTITLLEAIRLPREETGAPVLPAVPSDPNAPPPITIPKDRAQSPKEVPQTPVAQKTLVMHTMTPCVWCRSDKAKIIPVWVAKGYNVVYVDEGPGIPGNRYPWYEITDENGTKKTHVGSLSAFR